MTVAIDRSVPGTSAHRQPWVAQEPLVTVGEPTSHKAGARAGNESHVHA